METIETYKDYISTLHTRANATGKEKMEAEQRLKNFKETQPELYEEFREEKLRRRRAKTYGEEDNDSPVKITDSNEEIINKVLGTLRLIDEMKRCGIEIPQEEINEVKQLYNDKEIRKVLRESGNRPLLYLLQHRKSSFSRRLDTRISGELYYSSWIKIAGIQWVPFFEYAREAPNWDEVVADSDNSEIYDIEMATDISEDDRKMIKEAKQILDTIDQKEKNGLGNKKEYNLLLDSLHKYKGSGKKIKKYNYYLYLLLVWRRKSLDHPEEKAVYDRLRKISCDQLRSMAKQTLKSVSVQRVIGEDDLMIESFSDDEMEKILSTISDDAIIRLIDDNGMIDRDKLFEDAVITVNQIRNKLL